VSKALIERWPHAVIPALEIVSLLASCFEWLVDLGRVEPIGR
jgi:hypothetical protein